MLLFTACQKKSGAIPVIKTGKSDTAMQLSDSVQYTAYPFIDTFYGTITNAGCVYNEDTTAFVYAYYPYRGWIIFSSSYSNYTGWGCYSGNITGSFGETNSSFYESGDSLVAQQTYATFRVTPDSLYFRGTQFYCPDIYNLFFTGHRISQYHPHR